MNEQIPLNEVIGDPSARAVQEAIFALRWEGNEAPTIEDVVRELTSLALVPEDEARERVMAEIADGHIQHSLNDRGEFVLANFAHVHDAIDRRYAFWRMVHARTVKRDYLKYMPDEARSVRIALVKFNQSNGRNPSFDELVEAFRGVEGLQRPEAQNIVLIAVQLHAVNLVQADGHPNLLLEWKRGRA